MKKIILFIILCWFGGTVEAQDPHYSQLYSTPILLSPALTGLTNCQGRFALQYRNQWGTVAVPFETVSASYEQAFLQDSESGSFFGVGLTLLNDQSGSVQLRNTQVQLSAAYHQTVGENSFLSGGLQVGGGQNNVNGPFSYDNQFNGRFFDMTVPSGEVLSNQTIYYLDISGGLSYSYNNQRTSVNVGVAGFHLNEPDISFAEGAGQLMQPKVVMHSNMEFPMNDVFSLIVRGAYIMQGNFNQMNAGLLIKYDLGATSRFTGGSDSFVSLGAIARFGDAIIPVVKWQRNQLGVGISYDFNISELITASNANGGFELAISYNIGDCTQSFYCPTFN